VIQAQQINCHNKFVLCHGTACAPDNLTVDNRRSGEHNQFLYVIAGSGTVNQESLSAGLVDLTEQYGKELVYAIETDSEWVSINPIPYRRKLSVQIVDQDVTITPDTVCTLVCFTGELVVSSKTLTALHYAKLVNGVSYSISPGPGSVGAIISY
jgi:hypothetical protein